MHVVARCQDGLQSLMIIVVFVAVDQIRVLEIPIDAHEAHFLIILMFVEYCCSVDVRRVELVVVLFGALAMRNDHFVLLSILLSVDPEDPLDEARVVLQGLSSVVLDSEGNFESVGVEVVRVGFIEVVLLHKLAHGRVPPIRQVDELDCGVQQDGANEQYCQDAARKRVHVCLAFNIETGHRLAKNIKGFHDVLHAPFFEFVASYTRLLLI